MRKTSAHPALLSPWWCWSKRLLLSIAAWLDFCVKWLLTFWQVSCKFYLRSWNWLYFWKANEQTFLTIYCLYEILSTFHARVEYISVKKYAIQTSENEKSPKPPLPLGHVDPPSNTPILDRPHLPPRMTARLVHTLPHNCASKSLWLQWGAPHLPPKVKTATSPLTVTTPI